MRAAWSAARSRCSGVWALPTPTGADGMSTKDGTTTGRWLRRITQSLAGEPQDREELIAKLHEARERGLIDAEAMTMLEGVLDVSDLKVRDIMVPRAQMVFLRRDEPPERILPIVVES